MALNIAFGCMVQVGHNVLLPPCSNVYTDATRCSPYNCTTLLPCEHNVQHTTQAVGLFLTHPLSDDLNDNMARDSLNNSHCHPLVDDLPIPFCHLLQRVMFPLHRSPFWSGFLAQSLLGIVTHPIHCLPCLCNFVCPDTDNGPPFSLVICSYHSWFRSLKLAVENEMRRRLHFCRGNKILRTPCT